MFWLGKRAFSPPLIIWLYFGAYTLGTETYCGPSGFDCKSMSILFCGEIAYLAGFSFIMLMPIMLIKASSGAASSHLNLNAYEQRLHRNVVYTLAVLFLIPSVLFVSYALRGLYLNADPSQNARFLLRQIPMFGLAFRIILISFPTLCILAWSVRKAINLENSVIYILVSITLVLGLLSGSKESAGLALVGFLLAVLYSGQRLSISRIVLLGAITVTVLVLTLFAVASLAHTTVQDAFFLLVARATRGAAQGFYDLVNRSYTYFYGYGYGWYTFVKPFYTLAGTLRVLPKTDIVTDTGFLVSEYFRGPDLQTNFTLSIFGLGFLEGGRLGVIIVGAVFGAVVAIVEKRMQSDKYVGLLEKPFWIATGWALCQLSDWGYFDGWIVYEYTSVVLVFVLYYLIIKVLSVRYDRASADDCELLDRSLSV